MKLDCKKCTKQLTCERITPGEKCHILKCTDFEPAVAHPVLDFIWFVVAIIWSWGCSAFVCFILFNMNIALGILGTVLSLLSIKFFVD